MQRVFEPRPQDPRDSRDPRDLRHLLDRLLTTSPAAPEATPTVAAWWPAHLAATAGLDTIETAIVGGFHADRVGFAFAGGYHAALRSLIPTLPRDALAALAATEEGGAHPSAIRTSIERDGAEYVVRGKKTWITLADAADVFFVVASRGVDASGDGRNRLAVVRVRADAAGAALTRLPPTPFVPEIAHAELTLDAVRVAEADLLEGDGYDRYLKPFRTIEDLHVHGALLGYLVAVGRRSGWPHATIESLASLIVATCGLARSDPRSPSVHVALAGLLGAARTAIEALDAHWPSVKHEEREQREERERWVRDRAILSIAGKARVLRAQAAWRSLGGGA